jgi:hypothetical protein
VYFFKIELEIKGKKNLMEKLRQRLKVIVLGKYMLNRVLGILIKHTNKEILF